MTYLVRSYGGPNAEDELAAKAAGRELNGACWIAAGAQKHLCWFVVWCVCVVWRGVVVCVHVCV